MDGKSISQQPRDSYFTAIRNFMLWSVGSFGIDDYMLGKNGTLFWLPTPKIAGMPVYSSCALHKSANFQLELQGRVGGATIYSGRL
jgi:hypothetical protein